MKTKRRRLPIVLFVIIMLLSSQYVTAFSEVTPADTYRYFADGIECVPDSPLIKVDNEIYVPIRMLAESMKMTVSWDANTQEVTFEATGNALKMKIDSGEYTYNDITRTTTQKPTIYNGRAYIPLKFIAGIFGFLIAIDETAKRIDIYSNFVMDDTYTLFFEGERYYTDTPVFKDGGEYWVCMRDLAKIGPYNIAWDAVSQKFSMTSSENSFYLKLDTGDYTFNNDIGKMTPIPRIENGTENHNIYLPLKFMTGIFGISLTIDNINKSIDVNVAPAANVSGLTIYNTSYDIFTNVQPKMITRAELSRFLVKSFGLDTGYFPIGVFPDVTADNRYFKDIFIVRRNGLLKGYPDGTFRPNEHITRAEYAEILCKALKYDITENNVVINDVIGHWAESYIKTVVDAGLMSLNSDNCFEPDANLLLDASGQIIPVNSKQVTWKSDNENVAVVDKTGHITGVSQGNTVITCTTEDGAISKTCFVIVRSKDNVICGYIRPFLEVAYTNSCNGFKVEIEGTDHYALTNNEGYFVITCSGSDPRTQIPLKISKAGYLTRKVLVESLGQINSWKSPLTIWPGDIDGDNCINILDIMEMAKSFNSIKGDTRFSSVCDFDLNDAINITDIMCAAQFFNRTANDYSN